MAMRIACFLSLGAVLIVTGCDPGYQLTGTVKSSTTGAPIAGASAQAICASPPAPSATSDAAGTFHGSGVGFFADDCRIEVSAKGHETQSFPVGANCRQRHLGSCLHVEVNAVLKPSAP